MKKEMTIPALKKELAEFERKELEQMICDLYKNCDDAEQVINLKLLNESYGRKLLQQYQDKIHKIFFPKDIVRSGFSLSQAKGVISDFKKVCQNLELITELKLYYVECGVEFTNMYGDIDERFYDSVFGVFCDVVAVVSKNRELFDKWNHRLVKIIRDSDCVGWGFHDSIVEEYNSIPWRKER